MNPAILTDADRTLLDAAQRGLPLQRRPYAALAEQLDRSEAAVLDRLSALRDGPDAVVREIAGVFELAAIGYQSTLLACSADDVESAGEFIATHPGVSHCYQRSGPVNLWFTLTLGADSEWGIERTVEAFARHIGANVLTLPATKRIKLGVHVGRDGRMNSPAGPTPPPAKAIDLTDADRAAIRALQSDLPAACEPFAVLAEREGLTEADLLAAGRRFAELGVLRRYGAMLRHRRAGLSANVMVAWQVADEDAAAAIAAAAPAVSHCYLRPAGPGWPYTLYTMLHGPDRTQCRTLIDALAERIAPINRAELWTEREFKKARVRCFTGETARWEREQGQ